MARKANPKPLVTSIPITKARINLGALVKRIRPNKVYIILKKDGIPIAGMRVNTGWRWGGGDFAMTSPAAR
jgi:hypothetical protein